MSFRSVKIVAVEADPADYHKEVAPRGDVAFPISSSALRSFMECPQKWKDGAQDEETAATKFGSLFDCVLLTPGRFNDSYVVHPETYPASKRSKKVQAGEIKAGDPIPWSPLARHCLEWVKLNAAGPKGVRTIINKKFIGMAEAAVRRLRTDPILSGFIECSDRQLWLSGEWVDEPTGLVVPAKCLIDLAPWPDSDFDDSIGDVKTARNAKVAPWQSAAYKMGYHIQAAWNLWMYAEATQDKGRKKFAFLISENVEPWQIGRRMVDGPMLERGRNVIRTMMANYCSCLKHGKWPGYDDTDEAVKGWTVWREEPWMEGKELFATQYDFPGEVKEAMEEASDPEWMKDGADSVQCSEDSVQKTEVEEGEEA